MATTLLITAWVVTISAATYPDYSNLKMPQYAGNDYDRPRDAAGRLIPDDYNGRSIDASASLDYKYEEERRDNNEKFEEPIQRAKEKERWQKLSRKHRSTHTPENNKLENSDNYNLDIDNVSKLRSKHRNENHRPRLKVRSFKRDEGNSKMYPYHYGRERRVNDIDRKEYFHIDKDYDVYKSKNLDDEEITYVRKHTTEKIIHRKPRDRLVESPIDIDAELEELAAARRIKAGPQDYEYKLEGDDTRDLSTVSTRRLHERYRPIIDEEDHPSSVTPHRTQINNKGKTYEDYHDYYDMKRAYNIKKKLPPLLRRTTVPEVTTSTRPFRLEESLRRVFKPSDMTSGTIAASTTSTTEFTTNSKMTATQISIKRDELSKKPAELSLAEKSRLSILRKAQKKESLREGSTNKPPVLLQVTKKMITVVVVEPGTSQRPWMRARELSEDSPEVIRQVKLLMRKKLIAEANDMEELKEDWDEMICDYVDMSLITQSATRNCFPILLSFQIIVLFLVS